MTIDAREDAGFLLYHIVVFSFFSRGDWRRMTEVFVIKTLGANSGVVHERASESDGDFYLLFFFFFNILLYGR